MTAQVIEERKYLTLEEQKELLRVSSAFPRHRLVILLMMHAGLRVSEVVAIRLSNIDFRNRLIKIKSLKKRGRLDYRNLPLSTTLYDEIMVYISDKKMKSSDYLINNGGKQITRHAVNKFLKGYEAQSDLLNGTNLYPHKLRHTFATMLRSNSAEIEDIKDALGHQSIQTSLIYAHQDPKKLRELVNVSTAKSTDITLVQRIKKLFQRKKLVKVPIKHRSNDILIGRKSEKERVLKLLNKQVSTIILGETGTGKSYLLEHTLKSYSGKVLEFDDLQGFKKQLANTIIYLLKGDKEQLKAVMFDDIEDEKLKVKISKESTINLAKILCQITQHKEYVLSLNDLDSLTAHNVKALQELVKHFVVVATARTIKVSKADFLWDFERVELSNLKRADAMGLIYRLSHGLAVEDLAHLKTAIYEASGGNPRMIDQLISRLEKEEDLDSDTINEICNSYLGREIKQIDMSPYLLLIFVGLAVLRYMSAEVGNNSLRFIGGCFMIFSLFARYFFNSFGRKSI